MHDTHVSQPDRSQSDASSPDASPEHTSPPHAPQRRPAALADLPEPLAPKYQAALAQLRTLESVLVAFSGGVDSAVACRLAVDALGAEHVLAVTARSPSVPADDLAAAAERAAECGARHVYLDTHEFEDERYRANPTNRCYFCKTELYGRLAELLAAPDRASSDARFSLEVSERLKHFKHVINGVNADDAHDYRPGLQAAAEHQVIAPLADVGITKADVRALAAFYRLSVADKPAAPCLSSRVQYGEEITLEKLERIDAAETFLRTLGFRECRVRHHDQLARIEVLAAEIERLAFPETRQRIDDRFRELGYRYVALDLRGFRSGSMNEVHLGTGFARLPRKSAD